MYQDLVEEHLGASTGKHGSDVDYDCPFCDGHIHINYEKEAIICHRCDFRSRSIAYLLRAIGADVQDIKNAEESRYVPSVNVESAYKEFREIKKSFQLKHRKTYTAIDPPESFELFTKRPEDSYASFMLKYLTEIRGVPLGYVLANRFGFCREGKLAGMVVYPVFVQGHLLYYSSRGVLGWGPKSIHPKGVKKSEILYGLDHVYGDTLYLVEGVLDTLAFPGKALAVFGHSISDTQARLIRALHPREVVVAFDSDVTKRQANIVQICEKLVQKLGCMVSFIRLDTGDPFDNRNVIERYVARRITYNYELSLRSLFLEATEKYRF